MKKLSNAEADLKKSAAYKRSLDWKPEKKAKFLQVISDPFIYKFFKDFANHTKKIYGAVVFSSEPFQTILNTGTTNKTIQQSGKQDFFWHIL